MANIANVIITHVIVLKVYYAVALNVAHVHVVIVPANQAGLDPIAHVKNQLILA